MFLNDMNMYDALKKKCVLDYDANWLNLSGLELEKAKHNLNFVWYNTLVDYDLPIDYAATKPSIWRVSTDTHFLCLCQNGDGDLLL